MKRHTKTLQKKSRTHHVAMAPNGPGYLVTSGSSGKEYIVREAGDKFLCSCDWHTYHPEGECSHTAAVREWLAQAGGRTVYLKDSVDAYRTSHQKFEGYNQGIIITSKRAS